MLRCFSKAKHPCNKNEMFFYFNEDIRWAIIRKGKPGEIWGDTLMKKKGKCVTNSPEGESTPLSCSICYWGDVLWHPSWLRHPPAGGSITALWCIHLEFSHREQNENKTDASRQWLAKLTNPHYFYSYNQSLGLGWCMENVSKIPNRKVCVPSATCGQKLERLPRLRDIMEKTGRKRKAVLSLLPH